MKNPNIDNSDKYEFLSQATKIDDGFKVPENYFEKLPSQIQNRISTVKSPLGFLINRKLAFAVSFVMIFIISTIFYFGNSNNEIVLNEKFSDNLIEENMITEVLDASDLIEYLPEETLNDFYVNNNEIEEYLIHNNIDLNTIINSYN